jgi:hypothetical protein
MTNPTPLSPAAQAIVKAFDNRYENCGPFDDWQEVCLAAALRAVADQVVPQTPRPSADSDHNLMQWSKTLDQYAQRQQTSAELLAIAAELEGSNA